MGIAFEKFKEIHSLDGIERHKAWLKQYVGCFFSIAFNGKHSMIWSSKKSYYKDDLYKANINMISELQNRTRIEFDDNDTFRDENKAKKNLEITASKLKELGIGFIRSSHNGKSDYLWVEFDRPLKDKEKEAFLIWIAPENSVVDLNFASSKKVFPILYATHWKHSSEKELPIEYFEGKQINIEELGIKKVKIEKKKVKAKGFEYVTGIKDPFDVFDLKNQIEQFNEIRPIFYDKGGLFWLWNNQDKFWEMVDEVDILNMINKATNKDIISSKNRTEIINALKQRGRLNIPKPIKSTWLQFKNKIYDVETGENFEATPEYFVTNPIPFEVSHNPLTPTIDKIFEEWVGKEYVETLHEIIAYCLLPDYPLSRVFCFIGSGMNGKSCFMNLLKKFVGVKNCCSTDLDILLNSRFEVTKLHKKLVCFMGETDFNEMSKTSSLKRLTGGDLIGFEYKNKNPFEDKNYAKIIIATNNLPATTDKTIGFYRRWLIIDFPNQFSEKKEILEEIPDAEYSNLATNSIVTLNKLLKLRSFTNEGSIEDRMRKYEEKSNFLDKFIKTYTSEDANGWITKADFSKKFNSWCKENKFRELSDTSVGLEMKKKGFEAGHHHFSWMNEGKGGTARVWLGIKWQ